MEFSLMDGSGKIALATIGSAGPKNVVASIHGLERSQSAFTKRYVTTRITETGRSNNHRSKIRRMGRFENRVSYDRVFRREKEVGSRNTLGTRIAAEALRQSGNPFLPEILGSDKTQRS